MIETDYVWMKPLQAPSAGDPPAAPLAFPFGYIDPQHPNVEGVMRKMYPAEKGPLTDVPGSGPAPVMMRVDEWKKVACAEVPTYATMLLHLFSASDAAGYLKYLLTWKTAHMWKKWWQGCIKQGFEEALPSLLCLLLNSMHSKSSLHACVALCDCLAGLTTL